MIPPEPTPTMYLAASASRSDKIINKSLRRVRNSMVEWVRLAVPAAIVASMGSPAHAIEYLTVEQSQKLSFPSATDFVPIDAQAWKVATDGKAVGRYIVDHVIGKHL